MRLWIRWEFWRHLPSVVTQSSALSCKSARWLGWSWLDSHMPRALAAQLSWPSSATHALILHHTEDKGLRDREWKHTALSRPRLETGTPLLLSYSIVQSKSQGQYSYKNWRKIFLMMRRPIKIHCKVHRQRWGQEFGIFLQSIYHKWHLPLIYLKVTLVMRHFLITFLFSNSFKFTKKLQR